MTHIEELSLRFDGRIPEALRAGAEALDRAEAAAARKPVRLRVKAWKPASIVESMAAQMVRRRRQTGHCTHRDLRLAGFTREEITLYGDKARDRATMIWRGEDG